MLLTGLQPRFCPVRPAQRPGWLPQLLRHRPGRPGVGTGGGGCTLQPGQPQEAGHVPREDTGWFSRVLGTTGVSEDTACFLISGRISLGSYLWVLYCIAVYFTNKPIHFFIDTNNLPELESQK